MLHLYRILEFKYPVGHAELKVRFRELAKRYHPDVCKHPGAKAQFQLISNTYQELLKNAPEYVAPPPPPPKPRKRAEQNIFRVFPRNKSDKYTVYFPEKVVNENTRFHFLIDGVKEFSILIENREELPYTIIANGVFTIHIVEDQRFYW
jgi:hypothetical protein